jgi:hypothetical protein
MTVLIVLGLCIGLVMGLVGAGGGIVAPFLHWWGCWVGACSKLLQ